MSAIGLSNGLSAQQLRRKASLGIAMQPLSDSLRIGLKLPPDHGVYISNVAPESTAYTMGIPNGAVLTKIDGSPIDSNEDVFNLIENFKEGDSIAVEYIVHRKNYIKKGKGIARPKETYANVMVSYGTVAYGENRLRSILYRPKKEGNLPTIYFLQGYTCSTIDLPFSPEHPYLKLIRSWVDAEVLPDEMYTFGLKEIKKVKDRMKKLQVLSNMSEDNFKDHLNDAQFFMDDPNDVKIAFEEIKERVQTKATGLFPFVNKVPEVNIRQGTNAALVQVPAYYSDGTFYFNFFDQPFNTRQLGWFYIHEAIPGHHYQSSMNTLVNRTEIQNMFWYPGYVEGWGAYVEYLGKELGVFETIYDEYGKWEWDLIRSTRVCLDVGINYYG